MNPKHLAIRIEQCLALSKASNCPRRKFGAMLIDPKRNVVLMDGYNGGPRGAKGDLCGGSFCERNGLKPEDFEIRRDFNRAIAMHQISIRGQVYQEFPICKHKAELAVEQEAEVQAWISKMLKRFPGVESGTCMEVGCHHAEMNVVCNAAAGGVATAGAWLIVNGEPCRMCAKLIHHAGILRVYVVDGGYAGENGLEYLNEHGVEVRHVKGPQDPRL